MASRIKKIVKQGSPRRLRSLDRRLLIDKLGKSCHWCGIYTDDSIYNEDSPRKTTIDHLYNRLDPRRKGNNDKVVVACDACNQMRARMHEYIFRCQFPIKHALPFDLMIPEVVAELPFVEVSVNSYVADPVIEMQFIESVVEMPIVPPTTKKSLAECLNPIMRGPRIIIDVPPLTKWQKFVAAVSLKFFKLRVKSINFFRRFIKHVI